MHPTGIIKICQGYLKVGLVVSRKVSKLVRYCSQVGAVSDDRLPLFRKATFIDPTFR